MAFEIVPHQMYQIFNRNKLYRKLAGAGLLFFLYAPAATAQSRCQFLIKDAVDASLLHTKKREHSSLVLSKISTEQLSYIKFGIGLRKIRSIDDYAEAKYGEILGSQAITFLQRHNLIELITDAGVVMRLKELDLFLQNQRQDVSPWKIRQLFSDYLGEVEVYRAMALTEGEARAISKSGLLSAAQRAPRPKDNDVNEVKNELAHHSSGFSGSSDYISVTSYPTLAISVAKTFLKPESQKKLYLIKLKMPVIDLINFDGVFKNQDHNLALRINLSKVPVDYKLESFAITHIPPQHITSITQVSKLKQWASTYSHMSKDEGVWTDIINQLRSLLD